ncbi:MAG: ActS/PrrB/RegB family redox-sensitive histidine kinase [Alphaproteobacteria bacterium]
MPESGRQYLFNMQARGDWVRLRTLIMLRWIAIAGQIAAVLAAAQGMGFQLPLTWCALLISVSATVNIAAQVIYPAEKRLSEQGTLMSLFFDLAQLVALLMITGGLNNPFAVLIVAPVTISATALRLQSTLWLGITAMGAVTLMSVLYLPLVQADGTVLEAPELYRSGVAAAMAITVAFLAIYTRRVTVEGYAMGQALTAAQIELAREQKLAAIGGIAAATAHELGTPLATIKLAAGELARELGDHPELADDIALIRREAERCGEILADLGRGGRDDSQIRNAPLSAIVEEAVGPHRNRGKRVLIRVDGALADQPHEAEPMAARRPELIHGLRNVIQNAVDFAASTVWVDIDVNAGELRIAVGDDGPGFSPDILPRLGEPYVSTRRRGERREPDPESGSESRSEPGSEYEGMGLGLFIARTLLERTGARVTFANGGDARRRRSAGRDTPLGLTNPPGAIIEMIWPESILVIPKDVARRPLGRNKRILPQL